MAAREERTRVWDWVSQTSMTRVKPVLNPVAGLAYSGLRAASQSNYTICQEQKPHEHHDGYSSSVADKRGDAAEWLYIMSRSKTVVFLLELNYLISGQTRLQPNIHKSLPKSPIYIHIPSQ